MKITVCIGSSCHIKGSRQVVEQLQQLISENNLKDRVELAGTFCMGKCQQGVCVTVDNAFHSVSPDTVKDFFDKNLPDAVMYIPEATYLAWVDLSKCLPDVEDLPDFFANKAGVLLEGGNSLFVGNAAGYIRLNLAMPRSILKTGLERMRDTINAHNKH